jgi:hypothetical protein
VSKNIASRDDTKLVTADTITDEQILALFYADEIAAIELTVATRPGWSAEDRQEARACCAVLFNARTQRLANTQTQLLAAEKSEVIDKIIALRVRHYPPARYDTSGQDDDRRELEHLSLEGVRSVYNNVRDILDEGAKRP